MIQLQVKGDSYLCLCPVCGDCWARLQGDLTDHFWHRYIACSQHSSLAYGYTFSGSLLEVEWTNSDLLDSLPPDLVAKEFSLLISHLEHL